MKIKPIDRDVQTLLSSGFYVIPRFQRPYSWEAENISDFWNDVCSDSAEDYFIGSMVVFPQLDRTDTWCVVDGQQRLTTLTILLCAIRDALTNLSETNLANGIQGLIERKDIDNKSKYVLLAETSYPYFHDHIQKMEEPDSEPEIGEEEKALQLASKMFRRNIEQEIKGKKKSETRDWLKQLRDHVLRLKVIVIELDNEDDAYLIFETLNTRGKDLEVADLLKNLLTKFLKDKNSQNDTIKEKWKKLSRVAENLGSDLDLNSFVHHHWLSSREYVAENKLFRSLKSYITGKDSAKKYLDELNKEIQLYKAIFQPASYAFKANEKEIQDSLRALQIFRVRQPVPMMLSVLSAYSAKSITKKQTTAFFKKLENFHFRFSAITSQRSSGGISQMYSKAARDLRNAHDTDNKQQVIKELIQKLTERTPDSETFRLGFMDVKFSEEFPRQKALVKYILQKLHAQGSKADAVDYEMFSIEHLEPQSSQKLTSEDIASIGNLIFVPQKLNNEKLKNKQFSEKKSILSSNAVYMDEYLKSRSSWGKQSIVQRSEQLATFAYDKIWLI